MPSLDEVRERYARPEEPKPEQPKSVFNKNMSLADFAEAILVKEKRINGQLAQWQREMLGTWEAEPPRHINSRCSTVLGIDVASSPHADKTTMVVGRRAGGRLYIDDIVTLDNEGKP